jgi:hypothetical protein
MLLQQLVCICVGMCVYRRFSDTIGLLQPCMLPNFLSHINETLRLVTLAAAYLNMSDQTLISDEANTKQNWRNIPRNILFIQKGGERGSEGRSFQGGQPSVSEDGIQSDGKLNGLRAQRKKTVEACSYCAYWCYVFRVMLVRFPADARNFSSKHPRGLSNTLDFLFKQTGALSRGLIGQGVKLTNNSHLFLGLKLGGAISILPIHYNRTHSANVNLSLM